jgi:hypothetical protein
MGLISGVWTLFFSQLRFSSQGGISNTAKLLYESYTVPFEVSNEVHSLPILSRNQQDALRVTFTCREYSGKGVMLIFSALPAKTIPYDNLTALSIESLVAYHTSWLHLRHCLETSLGEGVVGYKMCRWQFSFIRVRDERYLSIVAVRILATIILQVEDFQV